MNKLYSVVLLILLLFPFVHAAYTPSYIFYTLDGVVSINGSIITGTKINWSDVLNGPTLSISGNCSGQNATHVNVTQYINGTGVHQCVAVALNPGSGGGGSGTVTSITRGFGLNLSGSSITSTGTLDVNDSVFQRVVSGSCAGEVVVDILQNGSLVCEADNEGTETDPQVGAVTNGLWCRGSGTAVECDITPVSEQGSATANLSLNKTGIFNCSGMNSTHVNVSQNGTANGAQCIAVALNPGSGGGIGSSDGWWPLYSTKWLFNHSGSLDFNETTLNTTLTSYTLKSYSDLIATNASQAKTTAGEAGMNASAINASLTSYTLKSYTDAVASNVSVLRTDNTTQGTLITNLQTDNTTQASLIAMLRTDNTTQATLITNLQTDNTTQAGLIAMLRTDNTTQAGLISTAQTTATNANVSVYYTNLSVQGLLTSNATFVPRGTLYAWLVDGRNITNTSYLNDSHTHNASNITGGTFTGAFTFASTLTASITGNAGTVTNGLYTTSTWTGGDLSGTGLAPQVSDNSHLHSASNITAGTITQNITFSGNNTFTGKMCGNAACTSYIYYNDTSTSWIWV